jgi:hypothetical protein
MEKIMTEIKNLKVYGLEESIIRSGYPHRYGEPDDLVLNECHIEDYIMDESKKRADSLSGCKAGSGHDNFLKGIIVQFDLKYPQYLTPQLQRYNWIDIVSSQSKMHTLTKQLMDTNNCNYYVLGKIMRMINELIIKYNRKPNYENFMRIISNLPMGFELWMGISTNYLQLKTIYHQRKNHKLKEDWGAIIKMIDELPYNKFIKGV